MIVVADTSPITNLLQIDQLELLKELFDEIVVPRSVADELADARSPRPLDVATVAWIEVRYPRGEPPPDLPDALDAGERDAIRLALELSADLLLMDEEAGRTAARTLGLDVMGLLGVLLASKRAGHLASVKTCIEELRSNTSFWIAESLIQQILAAAGE